MLPDVLLVIKQITETLDSHNIPYVVGGSVASSTMGKYRFTNDIDFAVDLLIEAVENFVAALGAEFYADAEMICDAVKQRSSFSILHLGTMVKADMFIRSTGAWSDMAWSRRRIQNLQGAEHSVDVYVPSPEDMILQKLKWYRLGNEVSDRQWSDVIGILEVQAEVIDYGYLQTWSQDLNLVDLLTRAYTEAEISNK